MNKDPTSPQMWGGGARPILCLIGFRFLQELTQLRGASMISGGAAPWPPPGYVPDSASLF